MSTKAPPLTKHPQEAPRDLVLQHRLRECGVVTHMGNHKKARPKPGEKLCGQ